MSYSMSQLFGMATLGSYLLGGFYYIFFVESPSEELKKAMVGGFPTDSTAFSRVQILATHLKLSAEDEYILCAFGFAFTLRHMVPLSGLYYMGLIAGAVFGFLKGIFVLTLLTTYGCTLQFMAVRLLYEAINSSGALESRDNHLPDLSLSVFDVTHGTEKAVKLLKLKTEKNGKNCTSPSPNEASNDASTRRSCVGTLLLLRLLPIFPSCFINTYLAIMGSTIPEFIISTALGSLPCHLYFLAVGSNLLEVEKQSDLLSKPYLLAVLALTLPTYYYFFIRLDRCPRSGPKDPKIKNAKK